MANPQPPVLRAHVLHRLVRLTPEDTDIEALDRFVQQRSEILAELEAIDAPWTLEEQDILAAAMRHAEEITASLETLRARIVEQIGGLSGATRWGAAAASSPQSRIKRRY